MGDTVRRDRPGRRDLSSLAIGWLLASLVGAAFALVCLGLVISGRDAFAWPGLVAAVLLVWPAQHQFHETHRRHYHHWPAGWQLFGSFTPERHEVVRAWTRRDPNRAVEMSRLLGIGLLALCLVAALVFIGPAWGRLL